MTYPDIELAQPAPLDRLVSNFLLGLAALDCGAHGEIRSGRSRMDQIRARQLAVYLACIGFDCTQRRVATMFGLQQSTVGYACRVLEERRNDPDFDARIETLEACLQTAPFPFMDLTDA